MNLANVHEMYFIFCNIVFTEHGTSKNCSVGIQAAVFRLDVT
jgi:hypothetical protein